ncbi:MAG: metal ABC transporter permease, partial [Planctomycetia bacterium]
SGLAALVALVLLRRFTRTRDDAATATVLSVSFGLGICLVSGITARGIPGGAGLEQFLLGHTAALTAGDATFLAAVSALAVLGVALAFKEATLVAFDPAYAAATGWPVAAIDYCLVALVAVMVVIPPAAARQWTDRLSVMVALSGLFGLAAAALGVVTSALVPRLATGPLVVLAAAGIFALSVAVARGRERWRGPPRG